MNSSGGAGAITTRMLSLFQEKADELKKAAAHFRDGSTSIEDPREEAATALINMKDSLMVSWAKDMTDLARLVAYLHNNMLLMRRFSSFRPRIPLLNLMLRSLYLKKVSRVKQAKNKVKALNPTTEFLFGGGVGELCLAFSYSAELNPLKKLNTGKPKWKQPSSHASGGFSKLPWKKEGFSYRGSRGGSSRARGSRGRGKPKGLKEFEEN